MIISLPNVVLLSIKGKDAERYCNARLTQNIKTLNVNATKECAALSSSGKVLSYGRIKKITQEEFLLLCDGGDPEEQRKIIAQFIVADRVSVEIIPVYGYHSFSSVVDVDTSLVQFDSERFGQTGFDFCVTTAIDKNLGDYTLFEAQRIRAGKISFPSEINQKTFLSEWPSSAALCFGKGCYVGQETIEKIDALGTTPKRILLLTSSEKINLSPGEKVLSLSGEIIGEVLSSGIDEKGTAVFARVVNEEEQFQICSIKAKEFTQANPIV